jgi:putative transport protein
MHYRMGDPAIVMMLAAGRSVAADLAILALSITIGLALGAIRLRGLKLGISGVLFSSLLLGQLGFAIDAKAIEFLRSFALIIFMYAIGLQVGPGFGASLKAEGLRLNLLSLCVIVLGALMAAMLVRLVPSATVPGLYSGAFTTTPGLAAAQEAVHGKFAGAAGDSAASRIGLAYSITYPFGVVGPMLVIAAMRFLFRVRIEDERAARTREEEKRHPVIGFLDIEVTSPVHVGKRLHDHPLIHQRGIVFSRLLRENVLTVPTADTLVMTGDIYRAVGPRDRLAELVAALGRQSATDVSAAPGDLQRMELVVTRTQVLHRSLRELDLIHRDGVTISRINRAGINLMPTGSLRLAFADRVTVVGPKAGLKIVETELGNSPDVLQHSQLIPIFLGIVLGVLVGSIPLMLPGVRGSIRIGLAGGPLLAALALSRLGSVGSIVWYMPAAANQLFRDFGLAIFLACVGFQSGDHFLQRAANSSGLALLAWGVLITLLPVFLLACVARLALRMDFITLAGWIAGAMSSSTALQLAEDMTESNDPAVAYAAVLPLAELAPILCAQVLAIVATQR